MPADLVDVLRLPPACQTNCPCQWVRSLTAGKCLSNKVAARDVPYRLPATDRPRILVRPLTNTKTGRNPTRQALPATETRHVLPRNPLWVCANLDPKLHTSGLSNNLGNSGGVLGCIAGFVGPATEFGASLAHSLGLAPGSIWNHDRHTNRAFTNMPLNSNLERFMRPTPAGGFLSLDFDCLSDTYIWQHMSADELPSPPTHGARITAVAQPYATIDQTLHMPICRSTVGRFIYLAESIRIAPERPLLPGMWKGRRRYLSR